MPRPDRRAEIMKAAEKLFTSRRYHEVTLDDVVRLAKVGKGTIYRYFNNKDHLFFEMALSGFDEMCTLVGQVVPDASFEERLNKACAQILSFFRSRRQLFAIMQAEEVRIPWCGVRNRDDWLKRRGRLIKALADILDQGVATGRLRQDIGTEDLAVFLLGMLWRWVRDSIQTAPPEGRPEPVLDLFLNGAARRAD